MKYPRRFVTYTIGFLALSNFSIAHPNHSSTPSSKIAKGHIVGDTMLIINTPGPKELPPRPCRRWVRIGETIQRMDSGWLRGVLTPKLRESVLGRRMARAHKANSGSSAAKSTPAGPSTPRMADATFLMEPSSTPYTPHGVSVADPGPPTATLKVIKATRLIEPRVLASPGFGAQLDRRSGCRQDIKVPKDFQWPH